MKSSPLFVALLLAGTVVGNGQELRAVRGDGRTDDTAAVQSLLDKKVQSGGIVELPPGQYLIAGTLHVPTGVTLKGSWEAPHHGAYDKGSTLLLTYGRGNEEASPAITLQPSSAIEGFTLLWPEQHWPDIVPYPWAIQGIGMHNTIENVTFVNAYDGIRIGAVAGSELHLVRNVFGCVLRHGIWIDSTSDVGRLENIHFNPHYWARSGYPSGLQNVEKPEMAVARYMADHLEAFVFGRSNWEYVENTFVFAAKVGYRFIKTPSGATNGQFLGIGADYCRVAVQIESIQNIGIQVTNGEFTSYAGEPNTAVWTLPQATGGAQFVNCNFWANPGGAARLEAPMAVPFSACRFNDVPDGGAIVARRGRLVVQACTFAKPGTAVTLEPGVGTAILGENLQEGGFRVSNQIGARAQIGMNERADLLSPVERAHYRILIGELGDGAYLGSGWYDPEDTRDVPPALKSLATTARWTSGNAQLHLPVNSRTPYTIRVWTDVPARASEQELHIQGGASAKLAPGMHEITLPVAPTDTGAVDLAITGPTWQPSRSLPASSDSRSLGSRVYAVEVTARGSENTAVYNAN